MYYNIISKFIKYFFLIYEYALIFLAHLKFNPFTINKKELLHEIIVRNQQVLNSAPSKSTTEVTLIH